MILYSHARIASSRHVPPDSISGKTSRAHTAIERIEAGLEAFLLISVFLVLASAAPYLRARLGFVH
jgi:hypothetical protein